MKKGNVISLEDRVPKIKQARRRKANRTLIVLLLLFFSLIGLIIYFQSPFSHVGKISIHGNNYYSSDEIVSQSGLSNNSNIWKINKRDIVQQLEKLHHLKSAKLEIEFPNEVHIKVTEYKRIAHVMKENYFYPVLENGRIYDEDKTKDLSSNGLLLFGFDHDDILKKMIDELQRLPEEVLNSISEVHHLPKEMDTYQVVLFMNDGFEVRATLRSFSEKMAHYPAIIGQLDPNKKGMIDLEVGSFFKEYQSFGEEDEDNVEKEG